MKKILSVMLVIALALFLMGCGKTDLEAMEDSIGEVVSEVEGAVEDVVEDVVEKGVVEEGVKEIDVTLRQWDFVPEEIKVQKGDKVKLTITSEDVDGGLAIAEFKINQRVAPGETAEVEFTADMKGKFLVYCSSPCGVGTSSMKGWFIVE